MKPIDQHLKDHGLKPDCAECKRLRKALEEIMEYTVKSGSEVNDVVYDMAEAALRREGE